MMKKAEAVASGLDRHSALEHTPSAGHLASRRHGSYPEMAFEEAGRIGTDKSALLRSTSVLPVTRREGRSLIYLTVRDNEGLFS